MRDLERHASSWTQNARSNTSNEHRSDPEADSIFRSDALDQPAPAKHVCRARLVTMNVDTR